MSVPFRAICSITLIVTLLMACGGAAAPIPAPPSASKSAADLKVTAQRDLKIDNTRIIALSPDGKWLAALRDKAVCIIAVDTLADKQCAEVKTGSLDTRSIVWSPDSKRIVFTEDLPRYMFESDIWTLAVDSGQLTDLTPDNVSGSFLKLTKDSAALLDTMPGWSPDGQTLIFSRSDRNDGLTTLYRVAVNGGSPEKILDAAGSGPIAVWYSPRWLGNGKIVYTINHPKQTEPTNGVWLADSNGQNAKQLLVPDQQLGAPILTDVSAKGDRALIWYTGGAQGALKPNVSYFALLDLNSGQAIPLKPSGEFTGLANAAFSPDGSKIVYVYRDTNKQAHLVVRDASGKTDNDLFSTSAPLGYSDYLQGLDWTNNDTLYAATGPGFGTLLTLGSK